MGSFLFQLVSQCIESKSWKPFPSNLELQLMQDKFPEPAVAGVSGVAAQVNSVMSPAGTVANGIINRNLSRALIYGT
jgi:hypothetical protein